MVGPSSHPPGIAVRPRGRPPAEIPPRRQQQLQQEPAVRPRTPAAGTTMRFSSPVPASRRRGRTPPIDQTPSPPPPSSKSHLTLEFLASVAPRPAASASPQGGETAAPPAADTAGCGHCSLGPVAVRRLLDEEEFARAAVTPDLCRDFVRRMRGCRLMLAWPRYYLAHIQTEADLGFGAGEMNRLSGEFLCCPEELVAVGRVLPCTADTAQPLPCPGEDLILLVGEDSRVYLYSGGRDNAVYLLGNDVRGFLKRGLRRFYPIYRRVPPSGPPGTDVTAVLQSLLGLPSALLVTLPPLTPIGSPLAPFAPLASGSGSGSETETGKMPPFPAVSFSGRDVIAMADARTGVIAPLPWPRGASMRLIAPRQRRTIRHRQERVSLVEFADVAGQYVAPALKETRLCVDQASGSIYAYNPWEDSIVRLADDLPTFLALGLRCLLKNYRFRCRLPSRLGDRAPRCPHVGPVPFPRGAYNDTCALRCLDRTYQELYGPKGRGHQIAPPPRSQNMFLHPISQPETDTVWAPFQPR